MIIAALAIMIACSLALAGIAWQQADYRWIYVCLFLNGVARAFLQPGKSALLPLIVPRSRFTNAVTWGTSGFQLATVIGPAAGGLLIAWTGAALWVYLVDAALGLAFVIAVSRLRPRPPAPSQERISMHSLFAGAAFVWRTKLILGAVSLDMFAVLLGGATALLPVYAKVILHSGADGLGWLAPRRIGRPVDFVHPHAPWADPARGKDDVMVRDRIWRRDGRLWRFALVLAGLVHAVPDGRL